MRAIKVYEEPLEYITIGKDDSACPVGIMMHGFGSHMGDLAGVARDLTKEIPFWILPQAPVKLIQMLGYDGFAWFPTSEQDLLDATVGKFWENMEDIDSEDIKQVGKKVIDEIIFPMRKESLERPIVVAGFSQGGMLVSEVILQALERNIVINTGIIMSSCLLAKSRWNEMAKRYILNNDSSITAPHLWQSHGKNDNVLTFAQAKSLDEFWKQYIQKDFFAFDGGHEVPAEVILEVKRFIATQKYVR